MKNNRFGGIALIVGAISGIITMSLHPVAGTHVITPAQFEKLAALLKGVHILAIAGIPFLFFGALALTRRLDARVQPALFALIIYSLSLVAVMIAPAMSGLVGTEILRKMVVHGAESGQWRLLMDYNHMINQAFSQIYVVASCVAIALWSLAIIKSRALSPAVGIYGLFLAVATFVALGVGLEMDVHGFGMIVFGEAIWLIVVGILLLRTQEPATAPVSA